MNPETRERARKALDLIYARWRIGAYLDISPEDFRGVLAALAAEAIETSLRV